MKWLARIPLLVLSLSLLSCSALSVIYLHNDTGTAFDYTIKATFDDQLEKPQQSEGTLKPNEVTETIKYFAAKVSTIEVSYTDGKTTHEVNFKPDQLPVSMESASSGGVWSHIKVGPSGVHVGDGSGNWGADFVHQYEVIVIGISIIAVGVAGRSLLKRRRARLH